MEKAYNEALDILTCAVCKDYMAPPIKLCEIGHSVCNSCTKLLPICTLCQGKFIEGRNLALEQLAQSLECPCRNQEFGCQAVLSLSNKNNHENQCQFRGYACFIPTCQWMGRYNEILPHFSSEHKTMKPFSTFNTLQIEIIPNFEYTNLIKVFKNLFWFRSIVLNDNVHFAVQLIETEGTVNKYHYSIEIVNVDLEKRRLILVSDVATVRVGYDDPINNENSVFVPLRNLPKYLVNNMATFRIKVLEEHPTGKTSVKSAKSKNLDLDQTEKKQDGKPAKEPSVNNNFFFTV